MSGVEYGLATATIILALVMIRLWTNPAMRAGTQAPSYAELMRQNEAMRASLEALTEQNTALRNRLQEAQADRQNLEITMAALRGEMGRSTR